MVDFLDKNGKSARNLPKSSMQLRRCDNRLGIGAIRLVDHETVTQ